MPLISLLILGLFIYWAWNNDRQEKERKLQLELEQAKLLQLRKRRVEQNKKLIYQELVCFAIKNEKVHYISYNLEEAPHQEKVINGTDLKFIETIIDVAFPSPSILEERFIKIKEIDLRNLYQRVIKEMPKSGRNISYYY